MPQPRRREESLYEASLCAGHLLVWTWRKMVAGEGDCPLVTREFENLAGDRARDVLGALGNFLLLLGRGSRRVLAVGRPLCAGITNDEGQILRLIAAAQGREAALVTAHLSWLVRGGSHDSVRGALEALSVLLADCDIVLPHVPHAAPPRPAALEVVR